MLISIASTFALCVPAGVKPMSIDPAARERQGKGLVERLPLPARFGVDIEGGEDVVAIDRHTEYSLSSRSDVVFGESERHRVSACRYGKAVLEASEALTVVQRDVARSLHRVAWVLASAPAGESRIGAPDVARGVFVR